MKFWAFSSPSWLANNNADSPIRSFAGFADSTKGEIYD
jgi:hypothetical protein